jgi:hypothetical protein
MLGWHFTNGFMLRDGQPLVAGKTYRVTPPPRLCWHGLHASVRVIDALDYAPGAVVSRVRLSGLIRRDTDKACATERTVLWCADATRILHEFALAVATDALLLSEVQRRPVDPRSWAALAVKQRWLDGSATSAELDAARDAALDAAWDAAQVAARDAARDAAWDAALGAYNFMLTTMLESLATPQGHRGR